MKIRKTGISTAIVLGLALFASGNANAKDTFDGSKNLICAAFGVTGCVDGTTCASGEARIFDMPEFMNIDFKKKVVHASYEDGAKDAESAIKNFDKSGSQLVLQGVENNHGWTMAVDQKSGRMSFAVVGEDLTYSVFGACRAL